MCNNALNASIKCDFYDFRKHIIISNNVIANSNSHIGICEEWLRQKRSHMNAISMYMRSKNAYKLKNKWTKAKNVHIFTWQTWNKYGTRLALYYLLHWSKSKEKKISLVLFYLMRVSETSRKSDIITIKN